MAKKYTIGSASFGCLEDKQIWILEGVLMKLDYIGRESELTKCEKDLKQLSIKQIKKVIKSITKQKQSNDVSFKLGDIVVKKSGKPFKSGGLKETIKGFCVNQEDPKRRKAVILSDDSICNIDVLLIIEPPKH
jgi:hypothetical protein